MRVLDVGAASGFFSFEMERRGAEVTATDLPGWESHDLSPAYERPDSAARQDAYLLEPFEIARRMLGARAERRLVNIYDLSPEKLGRFDLVFCGSVLVHLTDPVRALWRLRSVTAGAAIIATVIHPFQPGDALAAFSGHHRGDAWWLPTRAGFEAMVQSAGFAGWETFAEFQLDLRQEPGNAHGVVRAWAGERPRWLDDVAPNPFPPKPIPPPPVPRRVMQEEIDNLRARVGAYESMRYLRMRRWVDSLLGRR